MSHRPKRFLGQNFLVDRGFRERIVAAARVAPGEVIVEIGPGRGALTEGLVAEVTAKRGRLVLVELDRELSAEMVERFRPDARVEVVEGDILELPLDRLTAAPGEAKVVGNIPYNLTSPIVFHLLRPPRPKEVLLMVQREVADRILAAPATREYGALSIGVRAVAEVERVLQVPAGAFRPRPRVESAVIRITPFAPAKLAPSEEDRLRDLVRAVFQWRRKQLGKILRDHPDLTLGPDAVDRVLAAGGAEGSDRPETVDPDGFIRMARALSV